MSRSVTRILGTGLTMIEVVVAMAVLGIVLVSVVQGVGLSARFQHRTAEELRGTALARELAERISDYPYDEPDGAGAVGIDAGEVASDPTTFDDVDDFHNYAEQPPELWDGTEMTGLDNWERSVTVEWTRPTAVNSTAASDQGAKRITVEVKHHQKVAGRVIVVRYRSAD